LHLRANQITWPPSDTASPASLGEEIVEAPVPPAVSHAIDSALQRLSGPVGLSALAVRSSGAEENSAQSSFAGQFTSLLAVDPTDVLESVKSCWASYLSSRSLAYRRMRGIPFGGEPAFAVIVQVQVFSRSAGVLFTVHPMDPEGEVAYLEANFGTGESVAGSLATPDGLTISRSTGKVVQRRTGTKRRMTTVSRSSPGSRLVAVAASMQRAPAVTDSEAEAIFRTGRRIEELQGFPQDVEWALEDERLWILQARPITGSPGPED
jgi:pyruvate,water dikinase